MADPANPIDDVNAALDAADKYIKVYNATLDQVVPWDTYQAAVQELERYKEQYSQATSLIVGQVKTQLLNAQDCYQSSVQTIYNWCSYATQILEIYVELISPQDKLEISPDEKELVITTLDEGIAAMTLAITALENASRAFNATSGSLLALDVQLKDDFNEKSSWFNNEVDKLRKQAYGGSAAGIILGPFGLAIAYSIAAGVVEGKLIPELKKKLAGVQKYFDDLKNTIATSTKEIETSKTQLADEVKAIGALQTSAKAAKTVIKLTLAHKKIVIDKVNALTASCNEYMKRHGKKKTA